MLTIAVDVRSTTTVVVFGAVAFEPFDFGSGKERGGESIQAVLTIVTIATEMLLVLCVVNGVAGVVRVDEIAEAEDEEVEAADLEDDLAMDDSLIEALVLALGVEPATELVDDVGGMAEELGSPLDDDEVDALLEDELVEFD